VGYLAYFAAAGGWYSLWEVATVPAEGPAQTLALSLELALRMVENALTSGRNGLALALAHDLVIMPATQIVVLIYLARSMLKR